MLSRSGALIVLFSGAAFAQGDVTLAGKITDAITHLPIAGAQVDWCCARVAANTDAMGTWSLHIKPTDSEGEVTVSKSGYGGVTMSVPQVAASRTLDFELQKAAHLSGRIVDRDTGKPLAGFVVVAAAHQGQQSVFADFAAKPSAADGSFAITADFRPGDYFLEIDPPSGARIRSEEGGPDQPDYVRSYFPDVPRAEMASPLTLLSGGNRDMELLLHKRERHHIAGVFHVPEGLESNAIAISVTAEGRLAPPLVAGEIPRSGLFQIDGLNEGSYHVEAAVKSADGFAVAFGGQSVELTSHSIDDLKLTLRRAVTVRAHVAMAEDQAETPKGLQFAISAFPVSYFAGVGARMSVIRLSKDRLSLEGYPPGEYWPTLKVPEGYAVSSVSFNGLPVLHSTVDLESPESVVSFALTSRPASVFGIVRDSNQNALPGMIVVLLPEPLPDSVDRFDRTSIHVTTADGNGAFRFTSLAPGQYRAIILNGADRERSRDIAFLRNRESSPVELDFGQNAVLDLRAK
jgi:hypothetical protein